MVALYLLADLVLKMGNTCGLMVSIYYILFKVLFALKIGRKEKFSDVYALIKFSNYLIISSRRNVALYRSDSCLGK